VSKLLTRIPGTDRVSFKIPWREEGGSPFLEKNQRFLIIFKQTSFNKRNIFGYLASFNGKLESDNRFSRSSVSVKVVSTCA